MATFWENCTIKAKLFFGIGAILTVFAVSSAIVLSFVNNFAGSADLALNHILPLRATAFIAQRQLIDADDNASYYIMDRNASTAASYLSAYRTDLAAVKEALPKLQAGAATEQERNGLSELAAWIDDYVKQNERVFAIKHSGRYDAAISADLAFDTNKGQTLFSDFIASLASRSHAVTEQVDSASHAAVLVSILGATTAILFGAAIAFALGSAISKRLKFVTQAIDDVVREEIPSMSDAMAHFAAGDLSARVASNRQPAPVSGKDETALLARSYNNLVDGITKFGAELSTTGETLDSIIGDVKSTVDAAADGDFSRRLSTDGKRGVFKDLGENLNRLMDVVSRTVSEIKEAADVVSTSAREISAGNGDLSQRTEEQASSLEETAASMEELTATVNQNAENARQANALAIGASDIARKGGRVVGEVVETMAAINGSGKKIVDIISVIDGIAFQTNILALNAAVEAARAGEQGRGFAVVAGEVRTLAQRSAAAAKEIKALIGDSVEKTTAGTLLVGQAGETMAEIVSSVKRVTDIMADIAAASLEQGSGIGQVNDAVTQMDKVTQQNAALVEEIAASAESLEERARGLVELVSAFTLVGDGARSRARQQASPAPRAAGPASHSARPAPRVATLARPKKHTAPDVVVPPQPVPPVRDADSEQDWSSF